MSSLIASHYHTPIGGNYAALHDSSSTHPSHHHTHTDTLHTADSHVHNHTHNNTAATIITKPSSPTHNPQSHPYVQINGGIPNKNDSHTVVAVSSVSNGVVVTTTDITTAHPNSDLSSSPTTTTNDDTIYRAYPIRWLILFIFAMLNITNAILWISFAPIQDLSASYFGVSVVSINLLSTTFSFLYLPGYILSFYLLSTRGLRYGLIAASSLQFIGAWVRCIGLIGVTHDPLTRAADYAFPLTILGQCLCALAQPMLTNSPAKLSGDWFPLTQRNLATTIAAMSNPIGIAIGQLIPTMIVQAKGDKQHGGSENDDSNGMEILLFASAGLATATMILTITCVKSNPPTPPSRSNESKQQRRNTNARKKFITGVDAVVAAERIEGDRWKHQTADDTNQQQQQQQNEMFNPTTSSSPSSFIAQPETTEQSTSSSSSSSSPTTSSCFESYPLLLDLISLLKNGHFLLLLFAIGIGLGLFNALLTVLPRLVLPAGYNADDSSLFGAALILCGLLGAAIIGTVMDMTRKYNITFKAGLIGAGVMTLTMLFNLKPGQFGVVCTLFGLMGAFMLPLLPLCMECAAECTYPISEDAAAGLILTVGNWVGVGMIFGLSAALPSGDHPPYDGVINPASILILSVLLTAVAVGVFYNGPLKRQQAEKSVM